MPTLKYLHREGDWFLVDPIGQIFEKNPFSEGTPTKSIVIHSCPKLPDDQRYWPNRFILRWRCWDDYHAAHNVNYPCFWCGQETPESIKALWKLHNWDNLENKPSGAGYSALFTYTNQELRP